MQASVKFKVAKQVQKPRMEQRQWLANSHRMPLGLQLRLQRQDPGQLRLQAMNREVRPAHLYLLVQQPAAVSRRLGVGEAQGGRQRLLRRLCRTFNEVSDCTPAAGGPRSTWGKHACLGSRLRQPARVDKSSGCN